MLNLFWRHLERLRNFDLIYRKSVQVQKSLRLN